MLCTGYLVTQVQAVFGEVYSSLRLVYSQEVSPLGTGGALRLALPLFASDPVLVMNGDSFCEANLQAFWAWHGMQGASATLLLTKMPDTRRYGRVHVDTNGRVLRFDEKSDNIGPGWINAGIYVLSHRLLRTIPVMSAASLEYDVFPAWIDRGLYGFQSAGRFLDIGIPESYATAEQFFAPEIQP